MIAEYGFGGGANPPTQPVAGPIFTFAVAGSYTDSGPGTIYDAEPNNASVSELDATVDVHPAAGYGRVSASFFANSVTGQGFTSRPLSSEPSYPFYQGVAHASENFSYELSINGADIINFSQGFSQNINQNFKGGAFSGSL